MKYKKKYKIKIFEFILIDNHNHLLVKAALTEALGHFMRTVNSLLARHINKSFNRDSQAARERFKSPLISNMTYAHKTMQYICLAICMPFYLYTSLRLDDLEIWGLKRCKSIGTMLEMLREIELTKTIDLISSNPNQKK